MTGCLNLTDRHGQIDHAGTEDEDAGDDGSRQHEGGEIEHGHADGGDFADGGGLARPMSWIWTDPATCLMTNAPAMLKTSRVR